MLPTLAASLDAAKRKLIEAEALEAATGSSLPHKLHPSSFVRMGLEIEDQQYRVQLFACVHSLTYNPGNRSSNTYGRIASARILRGSKSNSAEMFSRGGSSSGEWPKLFICHQASTYLPDESVSLDSDDAPRSDNSKPETWPLLLPSAVPVDDRSLCHKGVVETEQVLRLAQLQDSLMDLRRFRRALRNLRLYFKTNMAGEGQKTQTKSRAIETGVNNRINWSVGRYHTTYHALLELDPTGDWTSEYRELTDDDNKGPLKEAEEEGTGDGRYVPSWIWATSSAMVVPGEGTADERQEVNETARHEWMTCWARADRWIEEEELLQEEMRRVVVFLVWKSHAWSRKVGARKGSCPPDIQRGIDAYAGKQAYIHREIAISFVGQWLPYHSACGLKPKWVESFPWVPQARSLETKLPRWFPKLQQDAPRGSLQVSPVTITPPGTVEGLGMAQEHLDASGSRNEEKGEERGENLDSDSDDSDDDGSDDGEHEYDEGGDGDDHDDAESNDGFGFEYDDDYLS